MSKKPKLTVIDEDMRRRIELQNAEFKALEQLIKVYCIHQKTPVVEDDYPAVRARYEAALRTFLVACGRNGRVWRRDV